MQILITVDFAVLDLVFFAHLGEHLFDSREIVLVQVGFCLLHEIGIQERFLAYITAVRTTRNSRSPARAEPAAS